MPRAEYARAVVLHRWTPFYEVPHLLHATGEPGNSVELQGPVGRR